MEIFVNGKRQSTGSGTLGDFVRRSGVKTRGLVVAHNDDVVAPAQWDDIDLRADDRLELLHFVGGG